MRHALKLTSPKLQRIHNVLLNARGSKLSTFELATRTKLCAVSTYIRECQIRSDRLSALSASSNLVNTSKSGHPMRKSRNRVDAPTQAIREAVRKAGAVWIDCTGDGTIGFDAIVAFRGCVRLVEVKDGSLSASRQKLTDTERKRAEQLSRVGVTVHVVTSEIEALRLIGAVS